VVTISVVFITTALIAASNILSYFQIQQSSQSVIIRMMWWNVLLVFSLAMLIYAIHVLIYQSRRKRWLGIIRQANVDFLTGLSNQHKLLKDLKHSAHTNLAFLKFNNYNSILNSYGPAITDDVVRQVAAVLTSFEHPLMKKSACYYIQQAVFAILEDQDTTYENIATLTKAIVKKIMSTQYQVGDGEYIALNITVGGVRQNKDAYMLANMALQEAEDKKLNFYLIDQEHSTLPEIYKRDLALTQLLIQGIQQRRVIGYFQPIFSAKDKTIKKYECLSRFVDENNEILLMPNLFMPLAHHSNLYYLITQIMIKHAIRFAQENQMIVSMNVSISDINNHRTCHYMYDKIKMSAVGHLLQFELLENEAIVDPEVIVEFIDKLHDLGCQVGIDDLGKGYSNIERLISLPIDFVKIDRSIMENLSHNLEMHHVAKGIVKLAHKKGLEVVAEYCADAALTELAIDLGVDYLQGFYLGKPGPDTMPDIKHYEEVCSG
jgi:EAL domain-containing protein (putative c-di-GMP-specific phosphodiesterase class I)/GGDEF domain-containing protein